MVYYVTLDHAAKLYQFDISHLQNMCHDANIEIHILKPEGVYIVSETLLLEILEIKHQPEYQQFKWMAGHGIGIREASKTYGINHQTISRWVAAGWLPVIAMAGRKKLVDQAVMAYAAKIYTARAGRGRKVFNKNGVPRNNN